MFGERCNYLFFDVKQDQIEQILQCSCDGDEVLARHRRQITINNVVLIRRDNSYVFVKTQDKL